MSDMAPWQNKVAKKFYSKEKYIWKQSSTEMSFKKSFEMSFCAFVEWNVSWHCTIKGDRLCYYRFPPAQMATRLEADPSQKQRVELKGFCETTGGDLSFSRAWTLLDEPVSLGGPFGLCHKAQCEHRLQCGTGYGGEFKWQKAGVPLPSHPTVGILCVHAHSHTFTHLQSTPTHTLV